MKKSLLALAVLGAYAGVASAQSSVQLFGTLDVNGRYIKNDGRDRQLSMGTDGVNSSEIRFQGVEDLGGGLKAGFNLRTGFDPGNGTTTLYQTPGTSVITGTAPQNKFFNRRATVSLFSNAGELRLGRDYVPTFWTTAIFDAFGYNGIGSTGNVQRGAQVRQDNSIGYFLPSNLGGFYGQVMVAAGENGTSGDRNGRYIGGQFGFRAGPFDIAGAYSENRLGIVPIAASNLTGAASVPAGETEKKANVGGSFDFGFMKLMGYYHENKYPFAKEKVASISGILPFGQSEVRVGYDMSKMDQNQAGFADSDLENLKATYQYNLSKRTAVYGTVAFLRNKDNTIVSLPGTNFVGALPRAGGDSKGFETGIRHFF